MNVTRIGRCAAALLATWVVGCSGDDSNGEGPEPSNACSVASVEPAAACNGLDQCGGPSNFFRDPTCDNCSARADAQLCEAGACRPLGNLSLISLILAIPEAGVGANSFTLASIHPVMADGSRVTCARLLSKDCNRTSNAGLNVMNSTQVQVFGGSATTGMVYQTGISAEDGADRIVFVQATAERGGDGDIMAWGCVEGVTVPLTTDPQRLAIELVAAP